VLMSLHFNHPANWALRCSASKRTIDGMYRRSIAIAAF